MFVGFWWVMFSTGAVRELGKPNLDSPFGIITLMVLLFGSLAFVGIAVSSAENRGPEQPPPVDPTGPEPSRLENAGWFWFVGMAGFWLLLIYVSPFDANAILGFLICGGLISYGIVIEMQAGAVAEQQAWVRAYNQRLADQQYTRERQAQLHQLDVERAAADAQERASKARKLQDEIRHLENEARKRGLRQ